MFLPVSGTYGMGEYARSLAIARAASNRWPGAVIHFVLSRRAPYAAGTPFPSTLLDSSPTFHSAAVIECLENFKPDVVIFDNAGRTAQLRAARRVGARVVYISARARQRRKAFRWRWMQLMNEHWIAYPRFIAGRLRLFERIKLKVLGGPVVRYLDVISSPSDPAERGAIFARVACDPETYVLVVPGGGTGHPGAGDALQVFMAAARALAERSVPTVFVGPVAADQQTPQGEPAKYLHALGLVPQAELAELMRSARLVVANGGSTLLQAIACGRACVAVPIAQDQVERTRRCAALGVAVEAVCDAAGIVNVAEHFLQDEPQRAALARRAANCRLADGLEVAVQALDGLT